MHPRRNPRDRTNESIAATAFWWFGQAKHSPVDLRAEECDRLDNQIDVMGKAFLGLSIACARCHDHKFDPIRAQDYYSLTGFLRSSRQQLAFLADPRPIADFATWKRRCEPRCAELIGRLLNPTILEGGLRRRRSSAPLARAEIGPGRPKFCRTPAASWPTNSIAVRNWLTCKRARARFLRTFARHHSIDGGPQEPRSEAVRRGPEILSLARPRIDRFWNSRSLERLTVD